jgi:hypothetical protein
MWLKKVISDRVENYTFFVEIVLTLPPIRIKNSFPEAIASWIGCKSSPRSGKILTRAKVQHFSISPCRFGHGSRFYRLHPARNIFHPDYN